MKWPPSIKVNMEQFVISKDGVYCNFFFLLYPTCLKSRLLRHVRYREGRIFLFRALGSFALKNIPIK